MISAFKSTMLGGLALVALAAATPASADRGGDIAAGIIGGAAVGAIVGSAGAREARPVYVVPNGYRGERCGWLRQEALELLDHRDPGRAQRKWDEFRDCQRY